MATDRHQAPSYPLRMPEDLKTKVAEAAEANNRSVHAELLARLQESFSPREEVPTQAQMNELLEQIRYVNTSNARSLGMLRHWLSEHVMELYEEVPEARRTRLFRLYRDIAKSIRTDGSPGLEELLWQMMGKAPEHRHGADSMAELVRRTQGPWIGMMAAPDAAAQGKGFEDGARADTLVRKRLVGNLGSAEESAYEKVVVRATPLKLKPTSKGPSPSPTARKPKP